MQHIDHNMTRKFQIESKEHSTCYLSMVKIVARTTSMHFGKVITNKHSKFIMYQHRAKLKSWKHIFDTQGPTQVEKGGKKITMVSYNMRVPAISKCLVNE